ncbi:MAG: DsrE family protein [Candidatus Hodarchaeales archaeon]|jgi:peroxiredoxin family protein
MSKVAILVTSGTYANMTTMSLLASGAIANDLEATIFFMEDSVWALRKDALGNDTSFHSTFPEVTEKYAAAQKEGKLVPWWELLPDLKELGDLKVFACAQALDVLGLEESDLADFVDEIAGVTMFLETVDQVDKVISL